MIIEVDPSALLKWASYTAEMSKRNKPALAAALNAFGKAVVQNVSDYISEKTDLAPNDVLDMITVSEASEDNLSYLAGTTIAGLVTAVGFARPDRPSVRSAGVG